jgi:hypothetical protein
MTMAEALAGFRAVFAAYFPSIFGALHRFCDMLPMEWVKLSNSNNKGQPFVSGRNSQLSNVDYVVGQL